jgi:hypothetical protein
LFHSRKSVVRAINISLSAFALFSPHTPACRFSGITAIQKYCSDILQ